MKITKRQLRRIIREEKRRVMTESLQSAEEQLFHALDQYVGALEDQGRAAGDVNHNTIKADVLNFIDGYFEDTAYAGEQAEREEAEQNDDGYEPGQGYAGIS